MRLQAISAGAQVPSGPFTGAVHSVFRRACNIQTDAGALLALLAPELGNVPHGIRVRAPAGLDFSGELSPGQRVGCRAAVLRVAGSDLAVDLSTAEVWRGGLRNARGDLDRPGFAAAWQVAWQALQRDQRTDRDPLLRTVHDRGLTLAEASAALDIGRATASIRTLIGCGPGLTPAGDDLIVGFLAGLRCTLGDQPARRRFLRALGAAVIAHGGATNEISRTYLEHATEGNVAEPLARLAGAISDGAPAPEVARAVLGALSVGHTSGGDGVLGLLLGMQAWRSRPCEPGHG